MDTSQTSKAKPTIEEIKELDADELLEWIQKRSKALKGGTVEKFKDAEISGRTFLTLADNVEFFKNECHLPIGPSLELADLAREIVGVETAGAKSKSLSFIPCTPRRQQANSVAGKRQQSEDVELSYSQSRKSLAPSIDVW
jgi:hypothetical protein